MTGVLVLLGVPVGVFVLFLALARVLPGRLYRPVSRTLAVAPFTVWAILGVTSNLFGMIAVLAAAGAAICWALAALAGRIAGRQGGRAA